MSRDLVFTAMRRRRRRPAEKAVRAYAKAKGWGVIRFRHIPELLREVDDALWSTNVRDLIALAVQIVRKPLPVVDISDVSGEAGRVLVLAAGPRRLPRVLRKVVKTTSEREEAWVMLRELVRLLADPPLLGMPLADLDSLAKADARTRKRTVTETRGEIAEKLGVETDTFDRARRREAAKTKKRPARS